MRSPPEDLESDLVSQALSEGWGMGSVALEYVPEGGGSHHWKAADGAGLHFVTVDDLDDKSWLGSEREVVRYDLSRALDTARRLRDDVGLEFVLACRPTLQGEPLVAVSSRYTVSLFPFLDGRAFPFGPYPPALRARVLEMVIELHRAGSSLAANAPCHVLGLGPAADLDAFLSIPDRAWDGGPFSEQARRRLAALAPELERLRLGFSRLAELTAAARTGVVLTHGEPHPANLMAVGDRLYLIDWDTVGLAPAERDLSIVAPTPGDDWVRYEQATGHPVNASIIALYRLRWFLDDIASTVKLFRHPHRDTADTRGWLEGLGHHLHQIPIWLDLLDHHLPRS